MKELICIVCPKGCHLQVDENDNYKVVGNTCPRGEEYGANELKNPTRVLTSTVVLSSKNHRRLPVKTDAPIQKPLMFQAVKLLDTVKLTVPVKAGDVVLANVLGSGVNFVATRTINQ
ncbi:MAG: DUF1667 domain-containing protein [Oscillospiraceae bacterium]